jgi:hypothetical protein
MWRIKTETIKQNTDWGIIIYNVGGVAITFLVLKGNNSVRNNPITLQLLNVY